VTIELLQQHHDAGEFDKAEEVGREFVISCGDAVVATL
jgi:hypothetical protein